MAESMCRTLRDGSLEGEQAPTLTIRDTTASPFGFHVFSHVLSQLSSFILASKSQSRFLFKTTPFLFVFIVIINLIEIKLIDWLMLQLIVIVAFSRSPSFYLDLLKRRGIDVKSSHKW
jgi:hypothetical protein